MFTYGHIGLSMCKISASLRAAPLPFKRPKSALSHQESSVTAHNGKFLRINGLIQKRLPSSCCDSLKKINISFKYFDWPADNINTRGTDYPC